MNNNLSMKHKIPGSDKGYKFCGRNRDEDKPGRYRLCSTVVLTGKRNRSTSLRIRINIRFARD